MIRMLLLFPLSFKTCRSSFYQAEMPETTLVRARQRMYNLKGWNTP